MHHVLAPTSPVGSPRGGGPALGMASQTALEVWGLTKDMNWPASRGSVTALLPDLVAMNLELMACQVTAGHMALVFRYSDTVSNYSLVVVLDAIPEKKFDQAFQLELIKELCKPSSSELRSKDETFRAANTEMLVSRHERPVVQVAFLREKSTSAQKANLLRCVVVRDDGNSYVWEWSGDKFAWTYLNQFQVECNGRILQLETSAAYSRRDHILAWTSSADRTIRLEPLRFDVISSLAKHPTHIIPGNVESLDTLNGTCALYGSSMGLWIVTEDSIQLRSASTPQTRKAPFSTAEASVRCVHTTTGALILLNPATGHLWRCFEDQDEFIVRQAPWQLDLPKENNVAHIACHRQFLLALVPDSCHIYDLHSGEFITSITVSDPEARFWVSPGAVGIWSWNGVWRVKLPSAKQYSDYVASSVGPRAGLRHLKDYGQVTQFDQAGMALQKLRKIPSNFVAQPEWKLFQSLAESPAWLLSLLEDHSIPEELVDELRSLLQDMEQLYTGIVKEKMPMKGTSRTTPLNFESYDHLHAWLHVRQVRASIIQDLSYMDASQVLNSSSSKAATVPLPRLPPSFATSRQLLQESSLHLASWVSSLRYSRQLLIQLEQLLLPNLDFKQPNPTLDRTAVPSHVLFHEERVTMQESVRHPFYFEWLARLYFQHEPASLDPFVSCIASFCPRVFTLDGLVRLARPHADRALLAIPPLRLNLLHQPSTIDPMVLAYTSALIASQAYVEALHWLLRFGLVDHAKKLYLTLPSAVQPTWFWLLLEYVAGHMKIDSSVTELEEILALKPKYLRATHVVATLRRALPPNVPVHVMRPILQSVLKRV